MNFKFRDNGGFISNETYEPVIQIVIIIYLSYIIKKKNEIRRRIYLNEI